MQLITADPTQLQNRLQAYLENDPKYKAAFEYTKSRFNETESLSAHNWAHIYRDTLNAIVVGEAEGADMSPSIKSQAIAGQSWATPVVA
ncbi:MAG TPA: hypothetical protein VK694_04165 [Verrucomicrobiae bacterium]|nr:hypothetical protein [Verrucomicrobiae bacterium]